MIPLLYHVRYIIHTAVRPRGMVTPSDVPSPARGLLPPITVAMQRVLYLIRELWGAIDHAIAKRRLT